jgi:Cation transport ATPase
VTKIYQQTTTTVLKNLSVDPKTGLTSAQVTQSRQQHGANKLADQKVDPYWKVFLKVSKNQSCSYY